MTAATDLAKLNQLKNILAPGTLKNVLLEILPLANQVVSWVNVATSGSAVCRYNTVTGIRQYEVRYQFGDLANLVHEMTHVAVNESYGLDFINYPNRNASNVPARQYDALGRCTNEALRQAKQMDHNKNAANIQILQGLQAWANAANELTLTQKSQITSKLGYGMINPQTECDTVLNQILVWLFDWGFPITGHSIKKPIVNALYEEIEKAAAKVYEQRQAGKIHRVMSDGAAARRVAMGY